MEFFANLVAKNKLQVCQICQEFIIKPQISEAELGLNIVANFCLSVIRGVLFHVGGFNELSYATIILKKSCLLYTSDAADE